MKKQMIQRKGTPLAMKTASKGFTLVEVKLVEVILAVVVLGVLALVLGNAISDATDVAVAKVKTNNAAKMTQMSRDVDSLGGDVSNGGADIDTSSMANIIASLQAGVTVQGLNVVLDDNPNAARDLHWLRSFLRWSFPAFSISPSATPFRT